ncbi:MAG TPA: hypothetical protein VIK01_18415 [Polyangiaceae bacterium]
MVERQLSLRRYWIWGAALATGGLLFWVALHSDGGDWFISQTHGDIMYTALSRFKEFPYFSFVFNGGTYFLQDPQSNLFSPVVPLIMLAGPSIGLRLMEGIWGVLGVLAFVAWMRRRVCLEAALIAAVASVLSLGVLWKIAVGNDMFLWHLGLPAILWTAERVMKQSTIESMLSFGLVLGLLLLGPTFHSFTYLFLPAVPTFVLLEWYFHRPSREQLYRSFSLFAGGCALALLMVSPKLACWAIFPMGRPTGDFGAIPFLSGFRQLFDYSIVKDYVVYTARWFGGSKHRYQGGWGVYESVVALPPIASLAALWGIGTAFRSSARRQTAIFATVLICCGYLLACCDPIWQAFRFLTGGNFRVAPRFLGMTAFGLAVFAGLGVDELFSRYRRFVRPATAAIIATMMLSALWWTKSAGSVRYEDRTTGDDVNSRIIWPRAAYREERNAVAKINSFTSVVRYRDRRDILEGIGYTDGFLVVGNEYEPKLWSALHPQPIVVIGIKPEQVTVEHLRIKIHQMAARSRIFLRIQKPAMGLSVVTYPPDAHVRVREQGSFMVVENHDHAPVERVVLRAEFPISVWWLVVAVLTLVGTIACLVVLAVGRRRALPVLGTDANPASLHEGLGA